jgi:diphthamide synthase (EF-2-diphthine--ammonia ligase)
MGITMAVTEKAILTWSGGKDSALALYHLQVTNTYEVSVLLTNMTEGYDRISMHGVQSVLLERQGESLGLPVEKIYLTRHASNEEYEAKMRETLRRPFSLYGKGIRPSLPGDSSI